MNRQHLFSIATLLTLVACGTPEDNSSSSGSGTDGSQSSSSSSSSSSSGQVGPDLGSIPLPSTPAQAQPLADVTLSFNTEDAGIDKSVELWGLDTAWVSEANILRGAAFMGPENVDVVRVSFTPTAALVNGQLQAEQSELLDQRLDYVELISGNTPVVLNADPPTVDPWFGSGDTLANRWAELMNVTAERCEARGHTVLAAAPFNEPDYSTHQGSQQDFYNVIGALGQYPRFDNIRITGGNTLSAAEAEPWYDFLKDRLDEGNTHQLNGSFDDYAGFFQTVTADGNRAINDELHNVMEAFVGAEYGMQTGIWWGTAERARGEFVKTSDGQRLGYAEHRSNWTAAAVYRAPDGKVQLFGGASERQASDTSYRIVSKDRAVYFDGHGPMHDYTLFIPGGTGYWENQPNAERVVNITWGGDIQPPISGRYVLVNRNSEKVLEVEGGNQSDGANIQQGDYTGETHQHWNFSALDARNGQDYSYFEVTAAHSNKAPDVYNFGLGEGVNISQWSNTGDPNQHWYLDYAGDNWFYICSRLSAKCLGVDDSSVAHGANVQQQGKSNSRQQHWRLLPIDADIEFVEPSAASALKAYANSDSITLEWQASDDEGSVSYSVLRADNENGPYETIARDLAVTYYIDHSAMANNSYFYTIRAQDQSLNRSAVSNRANAKPTGDKVLTAHFQFENNVGDSSNHYHAKMGGSTSFTDGKIARALNLNGSDNFVQLPAYIANHNAMTITAWVYWSGGDPWQRIFDFGNDESQNMFLTANADSGNMRFSIKNGGDEQRLEASSLVTGQWVHVAVLLDETGGQLFINGTLEDSSSSITIQPSDINPVVNYIGRSQYPDPLFNGAIDDFRVYNYVVSEDELSALQVQ